MHALQDATTLTPVDTSAVTGGTWPARPGGADDLVFLEKLRVWSQQFPPAAATCGCSIPWPRRYRRARVVALRRVAPNDGGRAGAGVREREGGAAEGAGVRYQPAVNGWKLTFHAFDYNLDFFEVGALDDDRFKIGDPKLRIVERAAAAIGGLWGNHPLRGGVHHDLPRRPRRAAHRRRTLHAAVETDAAGGRVLVADDVLVPDFYLVDNPIDRYSIGDRTPGVVLDDDGALTITISHDRPRRREGGRELATQPRRGLPTRAAHVRTRQLDP